MEPIEVTGKTIEEAVQAGLSSLGLSKDQKDQVEIEVMDEGSRGFLGLVGFRHARVRMRAVHAGPSSTGSAVSSRTSASPKLVHPRIAVGNVVFLRAELALSRATSMKTPWTRAP